MGRSSHTHIFFKRLLNVFRCAPFLREKISTGAAYVFRSLQNWIASWLEVFILVSLWFNCSLDIFKVLVVVLLVVVVVVVVHTRVCTVCSTK